MPSDISPRRIPSELVDALARRGSPFQGLIRRPSDPEGKKGVIVDTALIKVAQAALKNYGALALHKGIGRQGDCFKACTILCLTIGPQSEMYLMKLGAYQQHKAG